MSGRRAVTEALRSGVVGEVLVSDTSRETQGLREVIEAAAAAGVPVRQVPRAELEALAEDHQGAVPTMAGAAAHELSERDLERRAWGDDDVVVVLDGITDPQNLGAAARSAEAAGVAVLVSRVKRSAPVTPSAVRSSAGALLHLPHARVVNITRTLETLKDAGFSVIGLDGDAPRDVYERPCPPGRIALVLGSEGEGISRLVREHCDELVSLPMRGKIASLNASASLAAALYAYVLPSRAGSLPLEGAPG